jgi:hypothetical protein
MHPIIGLSFFPLTFAFISSPDISKNGTLNYIRSQQHSQLESIQQNEDGLAGVPVLDVDWQGQGAHVRHFMLYRTKGLNANDHEI